MMRSIGGGLCFKWEYVCSGSGHLLRLQNAGLTLVNQGLTPTSQVLPVLNQGLSPTDTGLSDQSKSSCYIHLYRAAFGTIKTCTASLIG